MLSVAWGGLCWLFFSYSSVPTYIDPITQQPHPLVSIIFVSGRLRKEAKGISNSCPTGLELCKDLFFLLLVLGIEPRISTILGRCPTTEL